MVDREATARAQVRAEDIRLMQLVAAGDPQARRLLAVRLVMRVRRLSRRLVARTAEAEDAAQEAIVEILE